MKLPKIAFILMLGGLILAACASSRVAAQAPVVDTPNPACSTPIANKAAVCQTHPTPTAAAGEIKPTTSAPADLTRSDAQGSVTVEIKPENLNQPGDDLVFDVAMNTHMVDLSMDLAKLATLTTGNGETIQASQWDAPKGGHHVSGKLIFPTSVNGKPVLDSANTITLTIKGVDAPQRVFTWQLTQ
jgi:hypothetical protein